MRGKSLRALKALKVVQRFYPGVVRVSDADSDQEIEVTQRDATIAHRKDHMTCGLAVACKRLFDVKPIISISTCYLVRGVEALRYMTTSSIQREIVSFDRGNQFAPGLYILKKPRGGQRLGSHRASGPKKRKNRGKSPKYRHITTGIRAAL